LICCLPEVSTVSVSPSAMETTFPVNAKAVIENRIKIRQVMCFFIIVFYLTRMEIFYGNKSHR
jgi:hypothetical protein